MSKAVTTAAKTNKSKSAEIARLTIAHILKVTGQKPVGTSTSTFPHIPSGIIQIDNLLGGTPLPDGSGMICPGYARGRVIEVFGAESSGKTTLALGAVCGVQKQGGVAIYLDFENAVHAGYAKSIGVRFNDRDCILYSPNNLEEGYKMLYIAIKSGVDLAVIDSVAAMVPKSELDKKLDEEARIGALARAMSTNLAKMVQWLKGSPTCVMLINQTRATIKAGSRAGEDDNTSGGKAVKFYSTHRLKLTKIRADIVEQKDPVTLRKKRIPYGNVVQVKVVKNKLDGKQGHNAEIFIRFGYGIDEFHSLIESAIPRKLIKQSGSAYDFDGQNFKGKGRVRQYLIDNPKACNDLRNKVQTALLSEAPQVIQGAVEDEDIMSDSTEGLTDDELAERGDDEIDEAAIDNVLSEAEAEGVETVATEEG